MGTASAAVATDNAAAPAAAHPPIWTLRRFTLESVSMGTIIPHQLHDPLQLRDRASAEAHCGRAGQANAYVMNGEHPSRPAAEYTLHSAALTATPPFQPYSPRSKHSRASH
jgi:hypothetical protein